MNTWWRLSSTLFVTVAAACLLVAQDVRNERRIDSLISIMTIEEKFGQLNQIGGTWYESKTERLNEAQTEMVRKGLVGSFLGITGAAETGRIQHIAVEQSRLGIPVLFGADIIHGYRTIFPIPLAEASSWNPEMVERAAHVAAIEGSAVGVHWTYAPMVDIARDPRWGRVAEGSGEDAFLGSAMAAARVRGFQGKDLHAFGSLLACAKHFAAYGGAEAGRDYNIVDISERTLREVYLPPYKAAVDAGALTLMSSFNEINGVPASGNPWLLTELLRKEWGFNGLVVSDFESVREMMLHGVAATREEAGILGLTSGVEIDMISRIYIDDLPKAVREGRLPMQTVDEAVRRVLWVKFAYGLFENPYRNAHPENEQKLILKKEHRDEARAMARQSIVLLKNEGNLLPLAKHGKKIALIGPLAGRENRRELVGAWAWADKPEHVVPVIDGFLAKLSSPTSLLYDKGCELEVDSGMRIEQAVAVAGKSDIIVAVVGESQRVSGEAASKTDLNLHHAQRQLLEALQKTGKPVVLVLMNGRPLTIEWESKAFPAIIEAWHLGVEAGNALADVIFGDVNPSGKLPISFPRNVGQIPIYYNSRSTGRPTNDSDNYTSRYLDAPNSPLYPFGFGLSYTSFRYSDLAISRPSFDEGDSITVSFRLTNTGQRAGAEVAQLYIRDLVASVTRPLRELKGFRRVELNAGESKTIQFTLRGSDLAFYNVHMKSVVEPGAFELFVGGDSNAEMKTTFSIRK